MFLKKEFKNKFLKENNRNHPVCRMIMQKGGWQTKMLIEFANTLKQLKLIDINYDVLKGKIISTTKSEIEGIPFVDIAQMFLSAGCDVSTVRIIQGQKNPDLKVTLPQTNESIYIEISKMKDSRRRTTLNNNFNKLSYALNFLPPQLPFSCKQFGIIDDKEMKEVLEIIDTVRAKALIGKSIEYYEDNKIRLTVAHPDKMGELEEWCNKNDYRRTLLGPTLDLDETDRIASYKLMDEAIQIPVSSSGILYFPVNALHFWQMNPERTIGIIEKELAAYKNIYGIVLYSSICNEEEPRVKVFDGGHLRNVKRIDGCLMRYLFFIRNLNYEGDLSLNFIEKIYQSFY
ncbi:MAG: hypothetical protein ABIR18_06430 [Chitinophagaceae bacterium]